MVASEGDILVTGRGQLATLCDEFKPARDVRDWFGSLRDISVTSSSQPVTLR